MKTVKQLLRQPLKTLIGLTLMTLAAAIVCLCVGQALAAHTTKEDLNQRFSTVGIPIIQEDLDGNVTQSSFTLEDEFLAWLERMTEEHPETVKQLARHGILSAYIPELKALNMTEQDYLAPSSDSAEYYYRQPSPYGMPYTCAMLVITLDEAVITPVTQTYPVEDLTMDDFESSSDYYEWLLVDPDTEKMTATTGYRVEISGTVTDAVSLADGYRDPVGRFAKLTYTFPTREEAEALNLVPGEQYIVYGMNYVDAHWMLYGIKNVNGLYDHLSFEYFDVSLFRYLTEAELEYNQFKAETHPEIFSHLVDYVATYDGVLLTAAEARMINAVTMTLDSPVNLIEYEQIRDEDTGRLLEVRPITDVTYTDGNRQTLTAEEYIRRYQIPTIAKLEGSVEDFLSSEAGTPWQTALQTAEINNQAFAVIGVDRMDYLADFSLQRSHIVEGRDFTEEEQTGGSRVCILHESLAQANGLQVGDTVTLSLYETDDGLPYQSSRDYGNGILNPSASFWFATTPFTETAEYTIVGLWRGENLWPDVSKNAYAFSPNTVFVPKSSVQNPMEESNGILFNTIVPQNGQINAFHQLAVASGYAGRFKYNDQGYSTIAANFHNYEALAKQMLIIGVVIYTVLLLLLLLLYPGAQKKNVRTMQSFGAGFLRRFGYVMATSLGIVIPASVLGGWLGTALWDQMVLALQITAESAVALQLEPGVLTMVALAQLIFALILTICVAIFVAAPRGMSARR